MTSKKNPKRSRRNDPEGTKRNILEIATEEFAEHGLTGARVDAIAKRTRTSKRMIYYYFGGKDALYRAVLMRSYAGIRAEESGIDVDKLDPVEAMRRMIERTFEYEDTHPDFIRLVTIENLHQARYLNQVGAAVRGTNSSVISTLSKILEKGQKDGVFRGDLDAIDVHGMISSFCFFRVSNRFTFKTAFQRDFTNPKVRARQKKMIMDAVIGMLEKRPD